MGSTSSHHLPNSCPQAHGPMSLSGEPRRQGEFGKDLRKYRLGVNPLVPPIHARAWIELSTQSSWLRNQGDLVPRAPKEAPNPQSPGQGARSIGSWVGQL